MCYGMIEIFAEYLLRCIKPWNILSLFFGLVGCKTGINNNSSMSKTMISIDRHCNLRYTILITYLKICRTFIFPIGDWESGAIWLIGNFFLNHHYKLRKTSVSVSADRIFFCFFFSFLFRFLSHLWNFKIKTVLIFYHFSRNISINYKSRSWLQGTKLLLLRHKTRTFVIEQI